MLEDMEFDALVELLEAAAEWEEALAEHEDPEDPLHPPVT